MNEPRIAFLATPAEAERYVRPFIRHLPAGSPIVFTEDSSGGAALPIGDSKLISCWNRSAASFERLARALDEESIDILHVCSAHTLLDLAELRDVLTRARTRGVSIVYDLNTSDPSRLLTVADRSDHLFTGSVATARLARECGWSAERVWHVRRGVEPFDPPELRSARVKQGLVPHALTFVVTGPIGPEGRVEELLEEFSAVCRRVPTAMLIIMARSDRQSDEGARYLDVLLKRVLELGLQGNVRHCYNGVAESHFRDLLYAADGVILNGDVATIDNTEAVVEALGCCGVPFVRACHELDDAPLPVVRLTSAEPFAETILQTVQDPERTRALRAALRSWAADHSWLRVATEVQRVYEAIAGRGVARERPIRMSSSSGRFRLLMQIRRDAFSATGGDTMVLRRLAQEMRRNPAIDLHIDTFGISPAGFDLVQLFNFATPWETEIFARECVRHGVPYVVTTMHEDWLKFYTQMITYGRLLEAYTQYGQPREKWPLMVDHAKRLMRPQPPLDNGFTAAHAAALIHSGAQELECLSRCYPRVTSLHHCFYGCEVSARGDGGALFERTYGLRDYVLCVGRIEYRKNQLMLLKALEDSPVTVVFVGGAGVAEPTYESACRVFRRSGQTVFLNRLSDELLASAYSGARVHALPSWYELPGLVSIEAAHYGCNVVASDYGTIRDYLGELPFYCEPDSPQSIREAVEAAYESGPRPSLADHVRQFTWRRAAERHLEVYEIALRSIASGAERRDTGAPHDDGALTSASAR